jgi:tagatose-6-phosphate ketose/aldose isomerase
LVVSLARSGDSPESVGAVSRLLDTDPQLRHLVLTCNREGKLATTFPHRDNVRVIVLDDATNDRSLVMTSSFTNLCVAARFLSLVDAPDRYRMLCQRLGETGAGMLRSHFGSIARVCASGFDRVVFLGSGALFGAARESALKVLEMTAGAVPALCESYLGFRHGPMSFVHENTLVVCFLSSDPVLRAYESDLPWELDEKKLGLVKVLVGVNICDDRARRNDVVIECPGLEGIADDDAAVVHVMVGQLLAFFRSLEEGLCPDSPSRDGVINRVVPAFRLHGSVKP